jgi:hypothetical protein
MRVSRSPFLAYVLICLALLLQGPAARAQTGTNVVVPDTAVALEGLPAVRLDVTSEKATRLTLPRDQAAAQTLEIRIVDGRYYWASRDSRPLTVTTAGEFTYLSSAQPGQYVRLRRVDDRISYVEHLDMGSGSVTYWGELRIVLEK